LADCLNAFAVGAPLLPGFRIFSPDPALIRLRLAWMFAYKPFPGISISYRFSFCNAPFFYMPQE
jgi:hypothetical protein